MTTHLISISDPQVSLMETAYVCILKCAVGGHSKLQQVLVASFTGLVLITS